jgi:hypothetical protein
MTVTIPAQRKENVLNFPFEKYKKITDRYMISFKGIEPSTIPTDNF